MLHAKSPVMAAGLTAAILTIFPALAGSAAGASHNQDRAESQSPAQPAKAATQTAPHPLSNNDILGMLKAGLPPEVVIAKINSSPSTFDTSPSALAALKEANVPDSVILAMVQAPSGATKGASDGSKDTAARLEGAWSATFADSLSTGQMAFDLSQTGREVHGTYSTSLGGGGTIEGQVSGNKFEFELDQSIHGCPGKFVGSATIGGNAIAGNYSGEDCQGPHANGSFTMARNARAPIVNSTMPAPEARAIPASRAGKAGPMPQALPPGIKSVTFIFADDRGLRPYYPEWIAKWVSKNSKKFPSLQFTQTLSGVPESYLVVLSQGSREQLGFDRVTQSSDTSTNGTLIDPSGGMWTVETSSETQTTANAPYTIVSKTLYATVYDWRGQLVDEEQVSAKAREGGDSNATGMANLFFLLKDINRRGRLLKRVATAIAKSENSK